MSGFDYLIQGGVFNLDQSTLPPISYRKADPGSCAE